MWLHSTVLLSVISAYLQLTSPTHVSPLGSPSQSLQFLSSGDRLYASPSLQAYTAMLWMQFVTLVTEKTSVLTFNSTGKQVLVVAVGRELISGTLYDCCGQSSTLNITTTIQVFKWVHVGISVDSTIHTFTMTVTHWKDISVYASKQIDSLLPIYDSQTSSFSIGGFTVSSK